MKEDPALPQINMSKIVVGGGLAGAFFALAGMSIFLVGVPLIRYLFPVAVILGLGRCHSPTLRAARTFKHGSDSRREEVAWIRKLSEEVTQSALLVSSHRQAERRSVKRHSGRVCYYAITTTTVDRVAIAASS